MDMDMEMMTMEMYFYYTSQVKFLLKEWTVDEGQGGAFFGCWFATFAIGFFVEFLQSRMSIDNFKLQTDILAKMLEGMTFALKMFLAYILMLIVMTFNFWLLLAAVLGVTTGYMVFGFKPLVFQLNQTSPSTMK